MNRTLGRAIILSIFGLLAIIDGIFVSPWMSLVIMMMPTYLGIIWIKEILSKPKFKEVKYEQLPPETQKEIDRIEQIIKSCGGTIVNRKIEDDGND